MATFASFVSGDSARKARPPAQNDDDIAGTNLGWRGVSIQKILRLPCDSSADLPRKKFGLRSPKVSD
jgi:hypothetical protein